MLKAPYSASSSFPLQPALSWVALGNGSLEMCPKFTLFFLLELRGAFKAHLKPGPHCDLHPGPVGWDGGRGVVVV